MQSINILFFTQSVSSYSIYNNNNNNTEKNSGVLNCTSILKELHGRFRPLLTVHIFILETHKRAFYPILPAILHKTTRELCSFNMWPILDLFMSKNVTHDILQMVVLLWLPMDFRQPVKARGISQSLEIFFYVKCIKLNIPQLQMENSLVNNDSSLPYSQTLWCCTAGRVYLWVPLCSA